MRAVQNKRVQAGKLDQSVADALAGRLQVTGSIDALAPCQLVIEAIIEDLSAKQALFTDLEQAVDAQAILASNTSSFSIGALAASCAAPGRVLGVHFFNPAPVMKLVEVISPPAADPAATERAMMLIRATGKTVVPCRDSPGFIVNRCARPFYGEALALLAEGRTAAQIDAAMLAAGYRIGPLSLIDLVGADINLAATESVAAAMDQHPRYHVFPPLTQAVEAGRLGRKTGAGLLFPHEPGPAPADAAAIARRIEVMIINEAQTALNAGIADAAGIDLALKLGLNFPRGPFELLAARGAETVRKTLAALAAVAPAELKARYQPAPGL